MCISVRFSSSLLAFMTVLLLPIVHLKHFVHFHTNTHTIRAELLRQLLENIITKVSNPTKVLKTDFVKARVSDTLDTMTSPQSSPPPNPTMTSLPNSRTSPPPNPTQLRVLRQLYTHSPLTKQDIAIQLGGNGMPLALPLNRLRAVARVRKHCVARARSSGHHWCRQDAVLLRYGP